MSDHTTKDSSTGTVTLIGTMHGHAASTRFVRERIREIQPDVVAVELCDTRYNRSGSEAGRIRWLADRYRRQSLSALVLEVFFAATQKAITDLDTSEGDMGTAIRTGHAQDARVALIDEPIEITFEHLIDGLRTDLGTIRDEMRSEWATRAALFRSGQWGRLLRRSGDWLTTTMRRNAGEYWFFLKHGVTDPYDPEQLKAFFERMDADTTRAMIDRHGEYLPVTIQALIHDRDQYLAGRIDHLRRQGDDVVAVLGKGHVAAVRDYLNDPETLPTEHVTAPPEVMPGE